MSIDLDDHHERTLTPLPELAPDEHDRYLDEFKRRHRPVALRGYHRNDPALSNLRAGSLVTISEAIPDDVSYAPQTGDWQ